MYTAYSIGQNISKILTVVDAVPLKHCPEMPEPAQKFADREEREYASLSVINLEIRRAGDCGLASHIAGTGAAPMEHRSLKLQRGQRCIRNSKCRSSDHALGSARGV